MSDITDAIKHLKIWADTKSWKHAPAIDEKDGNLVITLEGLHVSKTFRESIVANQAMQRRPAPPERGLIPSDMTLTSPRAQIDPEEMGDVHKIENALRSEWIVKRNERSPQLFAERIEPQFDNAHDGTVIATIKIPGNLIIPAAERAGKLRSAGAAVGI